MYLAGWIKIDGGVLNQKYASLPVDLWSLIFNVRVLFSEHQFRFPMSKRVHGNNDRYFLRKDELQIKSDV